MRIITNFMDRVFSDSTPEDFKNSVSDKIAEAQEKGAAELKDGEATYSFREMNGDIYIIDRMYGETTIAKVTEEDITLTGKSPDTTSSATEPNVIVPKPAGETKPVEPKGSTEPNVIVDDTLAVKESDKDKAGIGKSFSDEVEDYCITFSEDEVDAVNAEVEEVKKLDERVKGTGDPKLAAELKTKAECLKAYSILAEQAGLDASGLYEIAQMYSDNAEEALVQIYSDMDVNEYFSEMSDEDINTYFSSLDEVESQVLYSALIDEENTYTFSEIQEMVDQVYSDMELEQSVTECFSDCDDNDINAFFSDLTNEEATLVYSAIEQDETLTFSDINEIIELANTPLTEIFSDFSEEDAQTFSEVYGEDVADIAFSMAVEDENYTFSDFMDVMEDIYTFSDADADQIIANAEAIKEAADKMKKSEDVELAKKVKVLADQTVEDAEIAKEAGFEDVGDKVAEACKKYSEEAEKLMSEAGVDPKTIDKDKVMEEIQSSAAKAEEKAEAADIKAESADDKAGKAINTLEAIKKAVLNPEAEKTEVKPEKPAEQPKVEEKPAEQPKEETKTQSDVTYSKYLNKFSGSSDMMKLFSNSTNTNPSTNSCLTSTIN